MLQDTIQDDSQETDERLVKANKKWLRRIEKEKDLHEDYRDTATEAWGVYLNDLSGRQIYYPLLWSVVNIEHSAVYSDKPNPDIRPRNSDRNPMFKEAADVMQRALEFYVDETQFDDNVNRAVDDYLVAGLGIPRVKLDAEIVETEATDEFGEPVLDEEGEPMTEPVITNQMVRTEHVPWNRFGWEPCSNWDHCEWIYFEHHLSRAEFKRRWPDANPSNDDSINSRDDDTRVRTKRDSQKDKSRVVVYEVWDKRNKEVLIVSQGNDEVLEANSDPLGLSDFWPIPKPLFLNLPSDELIPTTDYTYIEAFDKELNRLYKRARAVTEQIKATSLHDASMVEIEDWSAIADGDSIPVEHMAERLEGAADIRRVIAFWPTEERAQTLQTITEQIQLKRQHVDDLLGISDVIRGTSNPQDGQGTQQIKERWAGIRLRRKQIAVQHMVRDLFRIMAEITVEHVTIDNLSRMTQIDVSPEVYSLLQKDTMREFAITVETDSTIAKDEFAERRERTELLQSITQYVQIFAPAMASNQIPADLGREVLAVATDPYKRYSRTLDDVIEKMPDNMQQLQKANQQIQQGQQQIQQKDQQIQQMQYALDQFSQAEEARQNKDTEGKFAKDMSVANKNMAGLTDEQAQAGKTLADTELSEAKTDEIYNDIANPESANG